MCIYFVRIEIKMIKWIINRWICIQFAQKFVYVKQEEYKLVKIWLNVEHIYDTKFIVWAVVFWFSHFLKNEMLRDDIFPVTKWVSSDDDVCNIRLKLKFTYLNENVLTSTQELRTKSN